MNFETGNLYHIYNQGNNRQKIFFSRENYLFFLNKIKNHILPHADIVAWCLMPNHFHLMLYVHDLEIEVDSNEGVGSSEGVTPSDALTKTKTRTLNESIGILLRSYTKAINKQENSTGSVFRKETKAECLTNANGITPSFYGSQINVRIPEKEYPQACFNYIHQNPVKANLVKLPEEWEFSSYPDYYGIRDGKLINRAHTVEFGLVV
jgi:putative transposase